MTDPREREADAVATRVMRASVATNEVAVAEGRGDGLLQRACAACEHDDASGPGACGACEDEPAVQRKAVNSASGERTVSPTVQHGIAALHRSGGQALPAPVRADMELRFGRDFSTVRVHQGARSAALAEQLNARAFTVGRHIAFGNGEFDPIGSEGRRLLAHELTHTIQQSGEGSPAPIARAVASVDAEKDSPGHAGPGAEGSGQVVDCHPSATRSKAGGKRDADEVMQAHLRAVALVNTASGRLPAAPDLLVRGGAEVSQRVRDLARAWFKLEWPARNEGERALWHHVVMGIDMLRRHGQATRYKCTNCNQLGLALPGSRFVRLCTAWWHIPSLDKRAAVLVHEWCHHWGGPAGLMRRVFESYCGRDRFNKMSASRLVQMPDAYMGFIFELATGQTLTADHLCDPTSEVHPALAAT